MSSLPPPADLSATAPSGTTSTATGLPSTDTAAFDPWAEQVRRQAVHHARRRRRRRKRMIPIVVLVASAALASIAYIVNDRRSDTRTDGVSVTPDSVASAAPGSNGPEPTLAPGELVEVERVWLVDRSDGTFDWGVSVRTPSIAPRRSGVVIDVWLTDVDGVVVYETSGEVDGIGPDSSGSVAGRLTAPASDPVRIEFDVVVGVASNDRGVDELLSVRAIERTTDTVSGRIASIAPEPIEDVTMVLLWFDEDGEVVAAVPQGVERVRPGVEARFDIDLSEEAVPDGEPGAVVWTT